MVRMFVLFSLFHLLGMFCHTDAVKSVSVMEGETVFLNTDVCKQHYDTMRWYFTDTLIALINGPNTSCLYDGEDGRFRDRLKVDYETGSLNITNTRLEHTGPYEAEIIRSESSGKTQSLNRNPKCDSTKMYKKNINPEDIITSFSLTVTASDSGKNKNEAQIVPEDKEMETTVPGSGLSPDVPDSGLSPAVPDSGPSSAVSGSGPSPAVVAGIAVVLLLAAAVGVGVMIRRYRRSTNASKEDKEMETKKIPLVKKIQQN
ncbi:uncharacterized protein LOC127987108 [Carassius gibelio]|uniref:uncharacterized protein LOC127987108 n=1 Tax=Carassius gibelio TaxID=101364 RepID=UPI0022798125|nr:uncharacterized protein LOC127987108 [Carassius gibelio]